jgi:poly(A) polymerase
MAPMLSWLKSRINPSKSSSSNEPSQSLTPIIERSQHSVSRADISENALKVLYRLDKAGYGAYLVGGGVRDLLLGREPKDFDIATDASPEEVRKLFRNCRLIGRRFRLAHVHFGRDIIEVATFRGEHSDETEEGITKNNGFLIRDNVYGSLEEDAWRRDFTVNAIYYNIRDFSILDYTGGVADLMAGRLRIIGDPAQRFREDPVRMLRAVRFAAKLGFRIDPIVEKSIYELGYLLNDVSSARLFDEVIKLLLSGYGVQTFELLRHYELFKYLYPQTDKILDNQSNGFPRMLVINALKNTDERLSIGKTVNPSFMLAVLLWETIMQQMNQDKAQYSSKIQALQYLGDIALSQQQKITSAPKRFGFQAREIWVLQDRLQQRRPRSIESLLSHPRFRAAYDFLLLRHQSGEELQELVDWWTKIQDVSHEERLAMISTLTNQSPPRKSRYRKRNNRNRKPAAPSQDS